MKIEITEEERKKLSDIFHGENQQRKMNELFGWIFRLIEEHNDLTIRHNDLENYTFNHIKKIEKQIQSSESHSII